MNNSFDMYQNSGYVNKRNRKKTLVIDYDDAGVGETHLGAGTEFSIDLREPLIIDKIFDYFDLVYLGIITIFLGYNCFAYQKGLSKTSQRYLLNVTIILIVIHAIIPFITGYIAESIGK